MPKDNLIRTPRGMVDLLPLQAKLYEKIRKISLRRAHYHGFEQIETPIIEHAQIFSKGVGQTTDIVSHEMYYLEQKGEDTEEKDKLALRPENTAGIARSFIENGMANQSLPVRLCYWGPMFRHERPQAGRLRQFWQFGIEIIGDPDPAYDALSILIAWQVLCDLGLKDNVVEINSIGDKETRSKYTKKLQSYLREYADYLPQKEQVKIETNPMRVLDCKDQKCQAVIEEAPTIIDFLDDDSNAHFKQVLEYLEELEIPYKLNPHLVRGLDYYTKTVFEIREASDKTRQTTLVGGGRYDDLIALYGGKQMPAIGFSMGVDRVANLLKTLRVSRDKAEPKVFIVQLGSHAKKATLKIIKRLTDWGYQVHHSLAKDSLRAQLKLADKLEVQLSLILGQREVLDSSIIVKEMSTGNQETIDMTDLKDKLDKYYLTHFDKPAKK